MTSYEDFYASGQSAGAGGGRDPAFQIGPRIDIRFDVSVYRNGSCDKADYVFGHAEGLLASIFAGLFSVAGIVLNMGTISALLNFQRTRNHVTTLFIVSLALSDLIFSMFTLPTLGIRFFTG